MKTLVILQYLDTFLRWTGGLVAYTALGFLLFGIWRGTRRPPGRTSGRAAGWLRSALFYLIGTACFLTLSVVYWKPLPVVLSPVIHTLLLVMGAIIYFPGMVVILWGRIALGRMYFVSTSFGAQLYADHQLVTKGPFAILRHPMYLGLILAVLGSLLLYRTWTTLAFAVFAPFVLLRARREEKALAAEFGESWQAYCRRVPALLPRFRHKKDA